MSLLWAIIGFLSGLLGIGGGILLSPLLLLLHWASLKETAAVSSLFIFTNSIAGLLGLWLKGFQPNADIFIWLAITFVGGVLGAVFGSKKLNTESLRYILATVLLIACFKLLT